MKTEINTVKKEVTTFIDEKQIVLTLSQKEFEVILLSVGRTSLSELDQKIEHGEYQGKKLELYGIPKYGTSESLTSIQDSVYRDLKLVFLKG